VRGQAAALPARYRAGGRVTSCGELPSVARHLEGSLLAFLRRSSAFRRARRLTGVATLS
jgi:hypothetical protein